jgi:8-oxo-dGTP pyrophosphatase MutT (NUDIX family)
MLLQQLLLEYQEDQSEEQKYYAQEMLLRLESEKLSQPSCFDRTCQPGHFTASAFVLREHQGLETLLVHHRKLELWVQPGGHADGCEDLTEVAARELFEETGLKGELLLGGRIFDIDIHSIPQRANDPEHQHYDVRFLFYAPAGTPCQSNHESKGLQWFALQDLIQSSTTCPSVRRMANKAAGLQNAAGL